eukprot:TRINITY_DN6500_c0_g2_i1.p1 TRINITY_DN6500_c0_g2~~TRINITY_DN6500_c0_g2_i1.p1  ORF type:complete len:393 (+),score=88.87 TRINITY_DN6500_c0_g2_i1:2152-3330(+)
MLLKKGASVVLRARSNENSSAVWRLARGVLDLKGPERRERGTAELGDNAALLAAKAGHLETAWAIWNDSRFASLKGDVDAAGDHMVHLVVAAPSSNARHKFLGSDLLGSRQTSVQLLQLKNLKGRTPLHCVADEDTIEFLKSASGKLGADMWDKMKERTDASSCEPWETVLRATGNMFEKLKTSGTTSKPDLDLSQQQHIGDLTCLEHCTGLVKLDLGGCTALKSLNGLGDYRKLQELNLEGCVSLEDIGDLASSFALKRLNLSKCAALKCLGGEDLEDLRSSLDAELEELSLKGCTALESLSGLGKYTKLQQLALTGCVRLKDIATLRQLPKLKLLDLRGCLALKRLEGALASRKILFDHRFSWEEKQKQDAILEADFNQLRDNCDVEYTN